MARRHAAAVLAACLTLSMAAEAADGARDWLERMSRAVTASSYVGEFDLEGRGYSERMQIVHCVRDGSVSERLVSLGVDGRELVRKGEEITAYLPDKRIAIIERRADKGGLLGALPRFDGDIEQWYELRLEGDAPELDGRPAAVILVHPRDSYRFGHRLWIDKLTAMPVRTELLDASGSVVERLRFTRLEVREDIPDSSLEPQLNPADFRWLHQAAIPSAATGGWQVRRPPPGFRLSASSVKDIAGMPSPVSQLVLSDGLASVSVFIHQPAGGSPPAEGAGRAGASSTFSTVVDGQQVTALGEVPTQTLRVIVGSIARRD